MAWIHEVVRPRLADQRSEVVQRTTSDRRAATCEPPGNRATGQPGHRATGAPGLISR